MNSTSVRANSLQAWLLACRIKTLPAAFVPFLTGTALAYPSGYPIRIGLLLSALASALCIQIATNLFNDIFDFKRGADTSRRLGFQRASQSGLLTEQQIIMGGWYFFALAFLVGLPIILHGGAGIICVLAVSTLAGYLYTGGPYPLAYHGLGEIFVLLFYGFTATCAAYWLQTGFIDRYVLQLSLQTGCLSTILIAINNLRDHVEDKQANKNTLAVRFGVLFGRLEITFSVAVPYLMTFIWIFRYGMYTVVLTWLTFPVACYVLKNIWMQPAGKNYNKFFGFAALMVLLFSLCLSCGFLLTKVALS